MIGVPHNGSRLWTYLNVLAEHLNDALRSNPDLPLVGAMIPTILQQVVAPTNSPAWLGDNPLNPRSPFVKDSLKTWGKSSFKNAKVHLVATEVDPHNLAYRFLGLTGTRLDHVLPSGSDGLVDRRSVLALAPSPDSSILPWLVVNLPKAHPNSRQWFPNPPIAHRAPALFSYRRPGDQQLTRVQSQTTSRELAEYVISVLDSPTSDSRFSSLKDLRDDLEPLSQSELANIEASAGSLILILQILQGPVETQGNLRPMNAEIFKAEVVEQLHFRIDPPPNAPIADEVSWIAEVFGTNGVTIEGVTLIPGGSQGESVTLEFASSLVGDLVLYGSYLTPDGTLVYAVPKPVASNEPPNATLVGIEVLPAAATIAPGERLRPELWAIYSDGTRARRYPTGEHFTVTTSSPLTLDIANRSEWSGLAEGSATVTVNFAGMSAESHLTVLNPFPLQTFQEWKEARFTTEQLADPQVSGDDADFDGDGLTTLFEYVTGADPGIEDPEHRLWAALRSDDSEIKPVLVARLSARLAGMQASIEHSTDILHWEQYYLLSGEPQLDDPLVLDYANAGNHYLIWFDLPVESTRTSRFYRLSARTTP
jgi:hypothetical protein